MDQQDSFSTINPSDNGGYSQGGIQNLLRSKPLLIIAGGLIVMVLIVIAFFPKNSEQVSPDIKMSGTSLNPPTPTMTVQLKEAVQEANQSARSFDSLRAKDRAEFPWIRKFPISGEGKYFVYFDKEKKVFVGKLYPQTGDSIEQLKTRAKQHMEQREIPIDAYPFEWRVTNQ